MVNQLKPATGIKYNSVYLSDLKPVIDLYFQSNESLSHTMASNTKRFPLTEAFGLPIYTVTVDGKIVAYSSVVLNALGVQDFNVVVAKEYDDLKIDLLKFSKENYRIEEGATNNRVLKNSIYKLVDWLNQCD